MNRVIAIGDIHGCFPALESILAEIVPQPDDLIVGLGDFIDRGPESKRVIDRLIGLSGETRFVPILGNHEELLLSILDGHLYLLPNWLGFGGLATLESYAVKHPGEIPQEHVAFLKSCQPYFETETHFFVHATYLPRKPLSKQTADALRWDSLRAKLPKPHRSGKICICGHTSQRSGEVLDAGYIKCIDTHVYGEGWLTALDVESGQVWQTDRNGRLRRPAY